MELNLRTTVSPLLVSVCVLSVAPKPAWAELGNTFLQFRHSPLIAGNELFRFEGRTGARFRFGAASRCPFGTAVLYLDTVDGTVVQQTLLLPLPRDLRQARLVEHIAGLFLQDSGLGAANQEKALQALRACYEGGRRTQTTLGERVLLLVACDPGAAHLMIVVGLKPAQGAPVTS